MNNFLSFYKLFILHFIKFYSISFIIYLRNLILLSSFICFTFMFYYLKSIVTLDEFIYFIFFTYFHIILMDFLISYLMIILAQVD